MAVTVSISEARATLPDIIDRVDAGEEVTLTRHGQPVAVIIRPDALRTRRATAALAAAAGIHELLVRAGDERLHERPTLSKRRAARLLADVEAGRSAR